LHNTASFVIVDSYKKDNIMAGQKEEYFMTFYRDIALLHAIANKQTLFFSHMVSRMDKDQIIQMTPYVRKQIMDLIGATQKNKLAGASQYIDKLIKSELIASVGDGAYMINPRIHGYTNWKESIATKHRQFTELRLRYSEENGREIEIR